jgi:outer membrane protein OmpA-like peptidoglycan-associated protein
MKRFTFLLAVAALSVGCTSRIPAGFNPLASGNGGSGGPESIDTRSANARRDALAAAILAGNIPPEAILTTVYFDFDKYTVSASERAKIDAVAGRVKATDVIIAGYTDHFGTEEYNLGLSDRRAQSVREYLVKSGANQAKSVRTDGDTGNQIPKHSTKAETAENKHGNQRCAQQHNPAEHHFRNKIMRRVLHQLFSAIFCAAARTAS